MQGWSFGFHVLHLRKVDTGEYEDVGILEIVRLIDDVLKKKPFLILIIRTAPKCTPYLLQEYETLQNGFMIVLILWYAYCFQHSQ